MASGKTMARPSSGVLTPDLLSAKPDVVHCLSPRLFHHSPTDCKWGHHTTCARPPTNVFEFGASFPSPIRTQLSSIRRSTRPAECGSQPAAQSDPHRGPLAWFLFGHRRDPVPRYYQRSETEGGRAPQQGTRVGSDPVFCLREGDAVKKCGVKAAKVRLPTQKAKKG